MRLLWVGMARSVLQQFCRDARHPVGGGGGAVVLPSRTCAGAGIRVSAVRLSSPVVCGRTTNRKSLEVKSSLLGLLYTTLG